MKKSKKLVTLVLAISMICMMIPQAFAASGRVSWSISKSKTATNLDKDYKSEVTLSLPAADYKKDLDVVFVLDGSTSTDEDSLAEQTAELLDGLAAYENLNVKAGLVIFGGTTVLLNEENEAINNLMELTDETAALLKGEIVNTAYDGMAGRSGSNLQGGVDAARALLEADTAVAAEDKYIIILSDGAARMWCENGEAVSQAYYANLDAPNVVFWNSNSDFLDVRWKDDNEPTRSFSDVWSAAAEGKDIGSYGMLKSVYDTGKATGVYPEGSVASYDTVKNDPDYFTTYEAATYYAAVSITEATEEANVILVSYPYHSEKNYGMYIESFKAWLAENGVTRYDSADSSAEQIFANVKKDLVQLVDAGSYVEDYMGYVDGEDGYDFDFVNDAAALSMKVGEKELQAEKIAENQYGFGKNDQGYDFVVKYEAGNGKDTEHFVWEINVPVTKENTVQLTYTVELKNPQTEPGTYGKYDADGSKQYEGLLTNNSAVLYPKDSTGEMGDPEEFGKPTVDYTVEKPVSSEEETSSETSEETLSTPDDELPPTGGKAMIPVFAGLMIVSLIAVCVVVMKKRETNAE